MGWTILTNDLIWWIPFTVILLEAARQHQKPSMALDDEFVSIHEALEQTRTNEGRTLLELSNEKPTMLVFLRHAGCTFCREAISDVATQKDAIESGNTQVVFVHMSTPANALQMFARYGLENPMNVTDPNGRLYRAFALGRMSPWQMLSPRTWWRGLNAVIAGHGFGSLAQDGFQMPGVFMIENGRVSRAYRHNAPEDRPDYAAFACERDMEQINHGSRA